MIFFSRAPRHEREYVPDRGSCRRPSRNLVLLRESGTALRFLLTSSKIVQDEGGRCFALGPPFVKAASDQVFILIFRPRRHQGHMLGVEFGPRLLVALGSRSTSMFDFTVVVKVASMR